MVESVGIALRCKWPKGNLIGSYNKPHHRKRNLHLVGNHQRHRNLEGIQNSS